MQNFGGKTESIIIIIIYINFPLFKVIFLLRMQSTLKIVCFALIFF